MNPLRSRVISAIIVGDDLHVVALHVSRAGVRMRASADCKGFLRLQGLERQSALASIARQPGSLVVVAPAAWCVVGTAAITQKQWRAARAELLESVEHMFPIERDDALLGQIDLFSRENPHLDHPVGGALIAAKRSRVAPAVQAIESALGRSALRVISAHMALPALGLQRDEKALVFDEAAYGERVQHELAYGLPVALDESITENSTDAPQGAFTCVVMPGAAPVNEAQPVSPTLLAIAGALSATVFAGRFAPLMGPPQRVAPWCAGPTVAGAAAALLLVVAGQVWGSRLRNETMRIDQRMSAIEDRVIHTQQLRTETERVDALLRNGVQATLAQWDSPMPILREVTAALGEEGFYYRIEVNGASVLLRGEAASADAFLQRLVGSRLFSAAEFLAPVSKSSISGHDVFEIRAQRVVDGRRR